MATAPTQIAPVPTRPSIVAAQSLKRNPRSKGRRWEVAIGIALALAVPGAVWRAHLQNAITYETVPVERGTIQARVTSTSNLNAAVDVFVRSQLGKLLISIPSKLYVLGREP
jgi:hypothetical protein